MSNRSTYTPEEWEIVASLAPMAATAAAVSDGVTVIGTIKEMSEGIRAIQDGATEYAGNELISAILTEMVEIDEAAANEVVSDEAIAEPNTDPAGVLAEAGAAAGAAVDATASVATPEIDAKDPQTFVHEVVANAMQAREILAAKSTPDEIAGYNAWVLNVVDRVINRSKSGGFLGIGGERVGEAEAAFRAEFAAALGSSAS